MHSRPYAEISNCTRACTLYDGYVGSSQPTFTTPEGDQLVRHQVHRDKKHMPALDVRRCCGHLG
jgi:ectoine hydroxylase-related dioxygenase (phytanoyl-CoA dioxygenase family)